MTVLKVSRLSMRVTGLVDEYFQTVRFFRGGYRATNYEPGCMGVGSVGMSLRGLCL